MEKHILFLFYGLLIGSIATGTIFYMNTPETTQYPSNYSSEISQQANVPIYENPENLIAHCRGRSDVRFRQCVFEVAEETGNSVICQSINPLSYHYKDNYEYCERSSSDFYDDKCTEGQNICNLISAKTSRNTSPCLQMRGLWENEDQSECFKEVAIITNNKELCKDTLDVSDCENALN